MAKKEYPINEIMNSATMAPDAKCYANSARFVIIDNEFFLDFFFVEPDALNQEIVPKAELVQRVIIPANIAKGTAAGLANAILIFEKNSGIQLPDTRGRHEDDLVDIWSIKDES